MMMVTNNSEHHHRHHHRHGAAGGTSGASIPRELRDLVKPDKRLSALSLWVKVGCMMHLEEALLNGQGDQLRVLTSRIPKVEKFLRKVPEHMKTIEAIHRAAASGTLQEFRRLINTEAWLRAKDPQNNGQIPLHKAVLGGNVDVVRFVAQNYPETVLAVDAIGRTPLSIAKSMGESGLPMLVPLQEARKKLAEEAASEGQHSNLTLGPEAPKTRRSGATTPNSHKHIEIFEIEDLPKAAEENSGSESAAGKKDANGNQEASSTASADDYLHPLPHLSKDQISVLVIIGELDVLERLVMDGQGESLLGLESTQHDVSQFLDSVPFTLEKIAEIHEAASSGDLAKMEQWALNSQRTLLIGRDTSGRTPLHKAVLMESKLVIDCLTKAEPRLLHAKDGHGRTPLHYAAGLSDAGYLYDCLVSLGADPVDEDHDGRTPAYYKQYPDQLHLEASLLRERLSPNSREEKQSVKSVTFSTPAPEDQQAEAVLEEDISQEATEAADEERAVSSTQQIPEEDESGEDKEVFDQAPLPRVRQPEEYRMPGKSTGGDSADVGGGGSKRTRRRRSSSNSKNSQEQQDVKSQNNRQNGLYVHSSPPITVNTSNIRQYIRDGDIEKLYEVLLEGQGQKLVGESASDQKVRNFLKSVPMLMAKIDFLHKAVDEGNLQEVRTHLDRKRLAAAKDKRGVGLLHKALKLGHLDIARYLAEEYPESLRVRDNGGQTPLHYSCLSSDSSEDVYNILVDAGADEGAVDSKGKTAAYYLDHPDELELPTGTPLHDSTSSEGSIKRERRASRFLKNGHPAFPSLSMDSPSNKVINRANIRKWIHSKDVEQLEMIVWEGQGDMLLTETSSSNKIRKFLSLVPYLMSRIRDVHHASVTNNLEELEVKGEGNGDILASKDANGLLPMHKAAGLGHHRILEYLIDKSPKSINMAAVDGKTPLHFAAAAKDDNKAYDMLVAAGANEEKPDKRGKVPSYYASKPQEIDPKLLSIIPDAPRTGYYANSAPTTNGNGSAESSSAYPASRTARRTRENSQERRKGRSLSRRSSVAAVQQQVTPIALRNIRDEDVEKWIRNGDVDKLEQVVLDGKGNMVKDRKAWNEEVRTFIKRVPHYMDSIRVLHNASNEGDLKTVRSLTGSNMKLAMSKDDDGNLPIHKAALMGHADIVSYLAQIHPKGINSLNAELRTPLHTAAMGSDKEAANNIYDMLLANGAEDKEDSYDSTAAQYLRMVDASPPMNNVDVDRSLSRQRSTNELSDPEVDEAIANRDLDRLEAMLANGQGERLLGRTSSDPEIRDFLEQVPAFLVKVTLAHGAIVRGNMRDVARLVVDSSVAVARDSMSGGGATALHKSVLYSRVDVARFLINNFPEVLHATDRRGRTALHYAAVKRDNGHIYKILVNAGANPNKKDKHGKTPGHYMHNKGSLAEDDLNADSAKGDRGSNQKRMRKKTDSREKMLVNPAVGDELNIENADTEDSEAAEESTGDSGNFANDEAEINGDAEEEEEEHEGDDDDDIVDGEDEGVGGDAEGVDLNSSQKGVSTKSGRRSTQPFPGLWTDEGQYLATVLGDPLIRGLTEISRNRPTDPVGFLADYLHTYTEKRDNKLNTIVISVSEDNEDGESGDEALPPTTPEEKRRIIAAPTPAGRGSQSADSTARDERGQTVLHHASSRPQRPNAKDAIWKIIADSHASLAARDERYQTCRDVARAAGLRENVQAIDDYVVNWAAEGNRSELYHLLMEGYDHITDVKNSEGLTAEEAAEKNGQDKTVELLSGMEPFIELRNMLHSAIRNGDLNQVKETLVEGASQLATSKSTYGRTSLHVATLMENLEILEFLVQNFPETVPLQDNMGRTAMHYAMGLDNVDTMARILVKGGARKPQDYRGRVPSYYFLNKDEIQMLKDEEEALRA